MTPYPQEEVDRIYEGIQTLGRETLEALKEYGADRRYGYSWNVLDTAFYQISYFAHPQGQLLNDLDKAVNDMDADLPTEEVVSKGKAFLEKLLAVPEGKTGGRPLLHGYVGVCKAPFFPEKRAGEFYECL